MPHKNVIIKRKRHLTGWKTPRNLLNNPMTTFGKQRTLTIPLRAHVRRMQKK